ncbi:MAG: O-antigen ligase family protein [Rhodospirillales bacterium]
MGGAKAKTGTAPRLMFWLLVSLVLLAPLALGAVYPWSWGLLASFVGVLLLAWGARTIASKQPPAVGAARLWPVLVLFAIAAAWAGLQMGAMTPGAWNHPLWKDAALALGADLDRHVTVNPYATGSALLRLLSYGGVFWLALQYCRQGHRAKQVFYALTVAGLAYAAYGLAVEFTGAQKILWFDKTSYLDNLTSTFVNRNSYATYAGLGLLCATGLLVRLVSEIHGSHDTRRERFRLILAAFVDHGWVLIVAWVVIATALLLTESRAGVLSVWLGLLTLFLAAAASRTMPFRHVAAVAAGAIAGGVAFFALSGGTVLDRLARTSTEEGLRPQVYELTLESISDAPWLGTGYGTFADVFRMYRDESVPSIVERAHNTYLENALELGWPAAAALFLAVAVCVLYCALGVRRRRRDAIYPAVGVAASVLVAAHSLVDFSLQIPAVAVTYSLLLGAACAQSWSTRPASPGP